MSESHPVYISCTAGQNAFTDLYVRRKGDRLEIIGHPVVLLTEQEGEQLADAIREILFQMSVSKLQQPPATLQA